MTVNQICRESSDARLTQKYLERLDSLTLGVHPAYPEDLTKEEKWRRPRKTKGSGERVEVVVRAIHGPLSSKCHLRLVDSMELTPVDQYLEVPTVETEN